MKAYHSPDDIVRQLAPDIPITCFRPAALEKSAQWFKSNFPGHVLYAVKANPAPYVLQGLYTAGINHFDVASLPEIKLVAEHCPTARRSFMHPVKSRPAITTAYHEFGVRDFVLDSEEELDKILDCTGHAKDLTLVLRLAVANAYSEVPLADKFGAKGDAAAQLLTHARQHAERLGVSFHVGSQTMAPSAYRDALALAGDIIQASGARVDIVNVGGGFPSTYPDMTPPPLADYLSTIREGLGALPVQDAEFWSEPGRALVAESCSVIVKIDLRKDDALYINDGTYGSLFDAGSHIDFRFPVRLIRNGSASNAPLAPFRFYGPTCDSIDYMPGPFFLPADAREGDYIEIGQLGAYGNTMRTGFNGFSFTETAIVTSPPLATMYEV